MTDPMTPERACPQCRRIGDHKLDCSDPSRYRMTPERLAEIEARANAATPGPWEAWDRGIGFEVHVNGEELNSEFRETFRQADAEFIAEARTDVPALLVEVRRLHQIPDPTRSPR